MFEFIYFIFFKKPIHQQPNKSLGCSLLGTNDKIYNKKAQAAMEFLMTYGWAIMAFLVSLAALAYFGSVPVLNSPSGNQVCIIGPGFSCKELVVKTDGISVVIENGIGENLREFIVNITNSNQGSCINSSLGILEDGKAGTFTILCNNMKKAGNNFKGDIVVSYKKEGLTLSTTSTGSLAGRIESGNLSTGAPATPTCTDTDSLTYPTINYTLQGTATSGPQSLTDSCVSSTNLTEYYCQLSTSTTVSNQVTTCTYGCISGVCNPASPSDTNPPKYIIGSVLKNQSTVLQNIFVNFTSNWTDNVALDRFIFSIDQGSGFKNSSSSKFGSIMGNVSSNITFITAPAGTTVLWKFIVNDSSNNWNSSALQSFCVANTPSSGPNSGTTFTSKTPGTIAWTSPGNAASLNGVYAQATLTPFKVDELSQNLRAVGFNFNIPTNATINGIVVEFEEVSAGGEDAVRDNSIKIVKGGTPTGTDQSAGLAWSIDEGYVTFGSSTNLWGTTWTPADINAANFGVQIQIANMGAAVPTGKIDHIRITVKFTTPGNC